MIGEALRLAGSCQNLKVFYYHFDEYKPERDLFGNESDEEEETDEDEDEDVINLSLFKFKNPPLKFKLGSGKVNVFAFTRIEEIDLFKSAKSIKHTFNDGNDDPPLTT